MLNRWDMSGVAKAYQLAARPWKSKWQDTRRLNWTLKVLDMDMPKAYHSIVNFTNHLKRVHTDLLKLFPKDKKGSMSCPTHWDLNYQPQIKESHRPITLRDTNKIQQHVHYIPCWFHSRNANLVLCKKIHVAYDINRRGKNNCFS